MQVDAGFRSPSARACTLDQVCSGSDVVRRVCETLNLDNSTALTACLQNRARLSDTVVCLGLRPQVHPLRSRHVGCCCGQAWWSGFAVQRKHDLLMCRHGRTVYSGFARWPVGMSATLFPRACAHGLPSPVPFQVTSCDSYL
jgi:hypothetical protein